jgi:hypothetical protein
MGRFDPTYDDATRQRIIELLDGEGHSYKQAQAQLKEETGVDMPIETARKIVATDRRRRVPALDQANPVGPMVASLLSLYNEETHAIVTKRTRTDADLERAGKIAKALLDLDKLRKANQAPKAQDKPSSPLAAIGTEQPSQNSGPVSDAQAGRVYKPPLAV